MLNFTTNISEDGNRTDEMFSIPSPNIYLWLFVILSAGVFALGLSGNVLVWFAVWRNPRMRSATNVFLVNLAVADFLVILVCLPPTVLNDVTGQWLLGQEMCKAIQYLQKVSIFVSVLTLTAISMERWMAICRPLWFRQTSVRAKRIIVLLWLVSLTAAVPDLVTQTTFTVPGLGVVCVPSWTDESEKINLLFIFVIFYVIPLIIMTLAYVKVALCLWRSTSSSNKLGEATSVPRAQLLIRQKTAKMLIVVVLIFAICFLPVYILFIFRCSGIDIPPDLAGPVGITTHLLCYFNSAVNPAIYNFMSCNFRREFKVACRLCCRQSQPAPIVHSAYDGACLQPSPESTRKTRLTSSPNMTMYRAVMHQRNKAPMSVL